MRSIKRRFESLVKRYPEWSIYTSFAMAISGQNFSKEIITRWFNILVIKDDYSAKDKSEIIDQLVKLTKLPEKTKATGFRIVYSDMCYDPDME